MIPPQLNVPPIIQFMMLIYSNIYFAAQVKVDKPYINDKSNKMEFINELYVILITDFLVAMAPCSDFEGGATGVEMRFKLGLLINYSIIALFLSNFLFVAQSSFHDARLWYKKKYNLYTEKKRLQKIEKESVKQGDETRKSLKRPCGRYKF